MSRPTDDLPELEDAFKVLGQMIVSAAILVAKQCDKYVHSLCPTYENDKLQSIIIESRCCKARLLHYYSNESLSKSIDIKDKENEPIDNLNLNMSSSIYEPINSPFTADDEFSSWCGWHNDHGSLTGLTSALLLNEKGEITDESDPSSGSFTFITEKILIHVEYKCFRL